MSLSVPPSGHPHSQASGRAPPRGYKSLRRNPAPEPTQPSPKHIVGDGFSEHEAFTTGTAHVGKKKKHVQAATGLGSLELTQATKPRTQTTSRTKRKLDRPLFDFEDHLDHQPKRHNLEGASKSTADAHSDHGTSSPALFPSVETGQGEANQPLAEAWGTQAGTSRHFDPSPSPFSTSKYSKLKREDRTDWRINHLRGPSNGSY